jgi:hypothetical protein
VTTDFPALDGWRDLVRVAGDAETFAAHVRAAIAEPYDPAPARARVAPETWDAKAESILAAMRDLGFAYTPAASSASWPDAVRAASAAKAAS